MNAIFFDLDGTLFDSRTDLASAVNFTRVDLGLKPLPQDTVIGFVGCGARYLLENAIPEVKDRFDELRPQFSANYRAHMTDETTLYPGVRRTLEELADRGWLMGVNTNKPNFAACDLLAHFGILRYFGNAVIAGGDCVEMKPSGMPLRECASRMRGHRFSSHDWMVGDNWTDMESGSAAGVKTAFCTFGFGHLRESRYTVKINCICDGGQYLYSSALVANCLLWNVSKTSYSSCAFAMADPLFVDRTASGTLLSVSPAIGLAERPTAGNYGLDFWKYATADVDGNILDIAEDGRITVGAFHIAERAVRVVLAEAVNGGMTVRGADVGESLLHGSDVIAISPADGTRPCSGVTFNGVTNLFESADGNVIEVSGDALVALAVDGIVEIGPIYTTDWYVDAELGDNGNTGFYPSAAKKTLASAAGNLDGGDTLHALPGRYDFGVMTNNATRIGHQRVVLRSGTSLVSTDGPENTIIVGGGDVTCHVGSRTVEVATPLSRLPHFERIE